VRWRKEGTRVALNKREGHALHKAYTLH
jgi:hypothetical protein